MGDGADWIWRSPFARPASAPASLPEYSLLELAHRYAVVTHAVLACFAASTFFGQNVSNANGRACLVTGCIAFAHTDGANCHASDVTVAVPCLADLHASDVRRSRSGSSWVPTWVCFPVEQSHLSPQLVDSNTVSTSARRLSRMSR
jgi:hypothetical protein